MESIQRWKAALNQASHIFGLLFKSNESDQGEFLERIVIAVLKEVKLEPLVVATYPVGLEQAMEDLQSKILKESELNGTIIVGIAGVGGVGKSALAKFLYNLKRSDFTRSCYLSEVREKGIASLQHKLIRDLLGYDLHIDNTSQGKGILRDRLGGLAVLVVLDDVDHFEQINSLLVTDRVGSGSLILITSRDQDLLRRCSPKIVLYNVKALQGKDARELFCRHAFLQSEPYKGFEDLVEKCLRICNGLPLCLQVLGAQLHRGRANRRYWELQLEKFSRCLPDDIIERLKVSYETLSNQEKEMFLDIGCFLAGEDKDLVFRVLEGLGYSDAMDCLESLRQKCLVEYHYDDFPSYDDDEIEYLRKSPGHDMKYTTVGPGCLLLPRNGSKCKYRTTTTTLKVTMRDHVKKMAKQIARKEIFVLPAPKPLRLSCSNDIQAMLNWQASHENLSAAMFSAKADDKSISNDQEVRYIMGKFKVKMVDIIFDTPTSESHMKIENFHSHSAILLCFISPHLPLARVAPLRVRFGASSYDATFQEYTTLRYRGERTLHVFIWTDESSLFKDYKGYRNIDVYCSDDSGTHSTVRLGKNASELDTGSVKMGWLLMVDKNIDVSKVGKEFIIALA